MSDIETTTETETTPAPAPTRKWTSIAGPIQTKKVEKALSGIMWEGRTTTTLSGIKGGEEHEFSGTMIFGPARQEAHDTWNKIGEQYGWQITRENYTKIMATVETEMAELRKSRPVNDERRTPEQDAARNQAHREAEAKHEAERNEKAAKAQALAADLRKLYPWAIRDSNMRECVRAAANLKEELGRTFPGVTFSVRSEGYDSIRVGYEFGPTTKEVEALSQKYRNAKWDGQSDSWDYDHSVEGEAVGIVLGRVRFIGVNRQFPSHWYSKVGQMLAEVKGLAFTGLEMCNICGDDDRDRLSDHVHRLLFRTSFQSGAEIVGVTDDVAERCAFNEAMHTKYGDGWAMQSRRQELSLEDRAAVERYEAQDNAPGSDVHAWCSLKLQMPTVRPGVLAPASLPATSQDGITVRYNREHNGVEIKFAAKPGPEVLSRIKRAGGWRYYSPTRVWYHKYTGEAWAWAHQFAGIPLAGSPESSSDPAGAMVQAQEDAQQDAVAAAIGA